MSDGIDEIPGIEELFDLVLNDFASRFATLADEHGVSNEDLQRCADRMRREDVGVGLAMAGLCLEAIQHRRVEQLMALISPGELEARGSIDVREIVEREARLKGDA